MSSTSTLSLPSAFKRSGGVYDSFSPDSRKEIAEDYFYTFCKINLVEVTEQNSGVTEFLSTLVFGGSSIRARTLFGGLSLEEGPYYLSLVHRNKYLPIASCLNGDLVCLDLNKHFPDVVIVNCATLGSGVASDGFELMQLCTLDFLIESILANNPFLPMGSDTSSWGWWNKQIAKAYNYLSKPIRAFSRAFAARTRSDHLPV